MKYISLSIYGLASLCLLFACKDTTTEKAVEKTTSTVMDTVPAFIIIDTLVAKNIELPAELVSDEKTDLLARVNGYIKEIKVDIGDKVRRGQTLAIIEAPELQTKYAEYQTQLLSAKARFLSSSDLYQRLLKASQASTAGIVAPVDIEKTKQQLLADSASYEAAKKLAQSYKEVAGYLVITAPFDGVVTARPVHTGALVGTTQSILSVEKQQKLRVRVAVPEQYVATVSGKEANFKTEAYPEQLFTAVLARKSGSIDEKTRTELWEYDYNNIEGKLKSGSLGYLQLKIERPTRSFIVPLTAIATTQERKFVIVVRDGKAEWVDVRQGMSTDKGIEIFGALQNGDTLVTRATDERKAGSTAYWKMNK